MKPTGSPLILLAEGEWSEDDSQMVAALVGAGRDVRVIGSGVASEKAARWLPAGVLGRTHGLGRHV